MNGNSRRSVKLGDLFTIKHGYAFKGEHFGTDGSHIVLTPGNFFDEGGFKKKGDKEKWYSGKIPEDYILSRGDLLVAMTEQAEGLLGSSAIVPEDDCYLHNQRLGLIQNLNGVDKQFLYYIFNSQPVRQQIRASCSGVKVRHTSPSRIYEVKVDLPPIPTQRKIASILSGYDDLIENNLRRIKILEEMAQSLYREWFVKFRFPGHQKVKMVDSPLGKIPEGWEVKPLESLISEHIGGGWGKEIPDGAHTEPAFVVRGTDIPEARRCNISNVPYRYHALSNLRSRQITAGDIIFEVSGGSKGQPLGRTLYISSELLSAFGGKGVICASFCKRVKPNARLYSPEILYLTFLEAYDSGEIEQFQVQSTGISNFKWTEYIKKTLRGVPPHALQAGSGELVKPLFSQIATLGLRNRNLRKTRDLLLPKLISGELDVSELDIALPEAHT